MITRLLARLRRGRRHRGPSGERILARDLAAGQVVSHPEWADGTPVRIVSVFVHQGEVFVRFQETACRERAWVEAIPAGTLVVLNPRPPATTWWRRAERAVTVAGLTALTLLAVTTIATAVHNLITGPPHLLDVARVVVHSGLLGLCIYLYRRRDA